MAMSYKQRKEHHVRSNRNHRDDRGLRLPQQQAVPQVVTGTQRLHKRCVAALSTTKGTPQCRNVLTARGRHHLVLARAHGTAER